MKTHNFILVGGDTDGLAFKKADQSPFTDEERNSLLVDLNAQMDPMIRWEDDGVFRRQLVVKAKNYVLVDERGKQKTKGSALKATTKEKALKRFVDEVIELLLNDKEAEILPLYMKYAKAILALTDITDWCSKHTITKAVLTGKATTQTRIRDGLKGRKFQEGDKVYMFFKTKEERCLLEDFDGQYDSKILLQKLYDTAKVFKTVIDIKTIPNLTLKKNRGVL